MILNRSGDPHSAWEPPPGRCDRYCMDEEGSRSGGSVRPANEDPLRLRVDREAELTLEQLDQLFAHQIVAPSVEKAQLVVIASAAFSVLDQPHQFLFGCEIACGDSRFSSLVA